MSQHYKEVKNGKGTNLTISEDCYISVGANGQNIMLRGQGKVLCFSSWNEFIDSINTSKATYYTKDEIGENEGNRKKVNPFYDSKFHISVDDAPDDIGPRMLVEMNPEELLSLREEIETVLQMHEKNNGVAMGA